MKLTKMALEDIPIGALYTHHATASGEIVSASPCIFLKVGKDSGIALNNMSSSHTMPYGDTPYAQPWVITKGFGQLVTKTIWEAIENDKT